MLRFTRWDAPPGFVVGRCDLGGALMIANAQGDPVKYVFKQGVTMVLNQLRLNDDGPLLVQEGTMQSLAAAIYSHEGWSVVGMTGMPESSVARELALCYSTV